MAMYLTNGTLNYNLTKEYILTPEQIAERNNMIPDYPDPNDERFKETLPVFTLENNQLCRDGVSIGKVYNNKTGKVVEILEINENSFYYRDTEEDALISKDNSVTVVRKLTNLKDTEETKLVAKFNVISTSSPTQIRYQYLNPAKITEIEVDGVVQSDFIYNYTFSTTGEHTVKYTLADNTELIDSFFSNSCPQLTSIIIPNTVTKINAYAFYYCVGLTEVTLSNNTINIGENAFGGCMNLSSITIPSSTATISNWGFANCTSLENITLSEGVSNINDCAFNSAAITEIVIPSSVKHIGEGAFCCANLSSIVVDSNNSMYDSRNNCNAIIETNTNILIQGCKNTIIPNTVTSLGNSSFCSLTSLTSISIPNSIISIGSSAFEGCSGLTSIVIPNSVTTLSKRAFYGTDLTSITIPSSVTSIGELILYNCSSLSDIVVEEGNTVYDSRDNCKAIIKSSTNELLQGCKNTVIPNSVTSIGKHAFGGCLYLTHINIPDTITSIGESAFYNCRNLENVTLPNTITEIKSWTFYYCQKFTSITIPENVTSIGENAFIYCNRLQYITSLATTAPTISNSAFREIKTNGTLTVPAGATGYDAWMSTGNYYLGKYNWTLVEQS